MTSSWSKAWRDNGFEPFLLRPVFLLLTFSLVLMALFQGLGRLAMANLHLYEQDVNELLAGQKIELVGLRGDWRGFNPIVTVDTVAFPAGVATGVLFELDVLESSLRSVVVPDRVHVDQVTMKLVQTDAGWRLDGFEPQADGIDVTKPLQHVDELTASVRVNLENRAGVEGAVHGRVRVANREARHYVQLVLADSEGALDDSAAQRLTAELWRHDVVTFLQPGALSARFDGTLTLPPALLGADDVRLAVKDSWWDERDGVGAGRLALAAEGIRLPGVENSLSAEAALVAERFGGVASAAVETLALAAGGRLLALPDARLGLELPQPPTAAREWLQTNRFVDDDAPEASAAPAMVRLWMDRLDLTEVTAFVGEQLNGWEPVDRWLRGLAARGEILNFHAFYDPAKGLGYGGTLSDLQVRGYRGAPSVTDAQGQLWGHGRGVAVQLSDASSLKFPDLFNDTWPLDNLQGVVKGWFGPGYFALRGDGLKAEIDGSRVAGTFSLTRPDPRYEQRVGLTLSLDQAGLARSLTFVPYKIPDVLANWIETGPRAGRISDVRFAYHGQVHTRPDELGRRIELEAMLHDGIVQYDPAWPLVEDAQARVHVAGKQTRVQLLRGTSLGAQLADTALTLHDDALYAAGSVRARLDGAEALAFVRASPLRDIMGFVTPDWTAGGALVVDGTLSIPLAEERSPPPLSAQLGFRLDGVALAMPELRVRMDELTGSGTFELPHGLAGEFEGRLFDTPARFVASHRDKWIDFAIEGQATPAQIYELIEFDASQILDGAFRYDAKLALAMDDNGVTNLSMVTDLVGLTIDLPAQFAKAADAPSPSELDVQFLSGYQSVRWQHNGTQGWLHYGDEVERGAVGIGGPPPMTDQQQQALLISGRMPAVRISDWIGDDGEGGLGLPFDWIMRDLEINRLLIDELEFRKVVMGGAQLGDSLQFDVVSPELVGTVLLPPAAPMELELDYIKLPLTDGFSFAEGSPLAATPPAGAFSVPEVDPITVASGYELPAAWVRVAQLVLGDEPFGTWAFEIRPADDFITFADFSADVNGARVRDGMVTWDLATNTSAFDGVMVLGDLAETLPLWDYAPSVETAEASVRTDASWSGSPANVSLAGLRGNMHFQASDGRFLDVASAGGLRIMSLLNFSNIAKRMMFDFSDVTKNGLSFERIEARVRLNEGSLSFEERMTVESSSSNFEVGGTVDLLSGNLNNEMIVTLPVSDSLPWYGVYLALANPLAGLGVLVGERVLRKPIQAFSTAKFEVRGTLEEPEVTFVSLWDRSISEPDPAEPVGLEEPVPALSQADDVQAGFASP